MVWAGICATGKTPLVFMEKGVKIKFDAYQNVLKDEALDTGEFWHQDVDLYARWRYKSHIQDDPRLVQGNLQGSDNKRSMASSIPRLESCGLFHLGIVRGETEGQAFQIN